MSTERGGSCPSMASERGVAAESENSHAEGNGMELVLFNAGENLQNLGEDDFVAGGNVFNVWVFNLREKRYILIDGFFEHCSSRCEW